MSDFQFQIVHDYNVYIGNVKKLVPNFFDDEQYPLNYKGFKLYLRLGLKRKKYIVY